MGSLERGVLTGFICRLCSDMHRVVLHIYGDEGIRMCISEKINRHLSINVSFFFSNYQPLGIHLITPYSMVVYNICCYNNVITRIYLFPTLVIYVHPCHTSTSQGYYRHC